MEKILNDLLVKAKENKKTVGLVVLALILVIAIGSCVGGGSSASNGQVEKDIKSWWSTSYPNQKIVKIEIVDKDPYEALITENGVERLRHEVRALVTVKKSSGEKVFDVSANYLGDKNGNNLEFKGVGVY